MGIFDDFVNAVSDAAHAVEDAAKKAVDEIKDKGEEAIDFIKDKAKDGADIAVDAAQVVDQVSEDLPYAATHDAIDLVTGDPSFDHLHKDADKIIDEAKKIIPS